MTRRKMPVHIIQVIPTAQAANGMIFARRQMEEMRKHTENIEVFDLIHRSPRKIISSALALRSACRTEGITILHAHFGSVTGFIAAIVRRTPCLSRKRRGRIRLVITFRGSDLNPDTTVSWARNLAQKSLSHLAAAGADHIICVSQEIRDRLWWRRRNLSILPTGCDTDRFQPPQPNKTSARARVAPLLEARGVDPSAKRPIIVINAGETPEFKGLPILEEAVVLLEARHGITADLFVCRNDIPPDEMPLLLGAADVVALASRYEGSPTVLEEALSCNTQVVSTPAGDACERLASVKGSFLASERSAYAMAEALSQALRYKGPINGREVALSECSQGQIVERILAIYAQVARGGCR